MQWWTQPSHWPDQRKPGSQQGRSSDLHTEMFITMSPTQQNAQSPSNTPCVSLTWPRCLIDCDFFLPTTRWIAAFPAPCSAKFFESFFYYCSGSCLQGPFFVAGKMTIGIKGWAASRIWWARGAHGYSSAACELAWSSRIMFGVMRIMVSKGQGALMVTLTDNTGDKERRQCLLSTLVKWKIMPISPSFLETVQYTIALLTLNEVLRDSSPFVKLKDEVNGKSLQTLRASIETALGTECQ